MTQQTGAAQVFPDRFLTHLLQRSAFQPLSTNKRRTDMSMMRRDPFEMATPLRDVMNRLLEESVLLPERFEMSAARAFRGSAPFPIDLSESADQQQYFLEADVAGLKPEEIQITSSGDTVTIHATKRKETLAERGEYVRRERYTGEISRTVELPSHIDAEKIQATCEQGVLTLRIPKAEGARSRQIPVQAKGD